jgi:hypothetical protein
MGVVSDPSPKSVAAAAFPRLCDLEGADSQLLSTRVEMSIIYAFCTTITAKSSRTDPKARI